MLQTLRALTSRFILADSAAGAKAYLFTIAVDLSSLIGGVVALLLAGFAFGPEGFGAYAVARRVIALGGVILGLGVGIGLPRALAIGGRGLHGGVHLTAALLYTTPAVVIAVLAWALVPQVRQQLLPVGGDVLAWGTLGTAIAFHLHVIAHGYFRGTLSFWTSSTIWGLDFTVIPVVAILVAGGEPATAIAFTGVAWGLVAMGALATAVPRMTWASRPPARLRDSVRSLAAFSAPRVPGDIALTALFAVPTLIVAHHQGSAMAGLVSLGLSAITLTSSVLSGVGQVLLPRVTSLAQQGHWDEVRRVVRQSTLLWVGATALGAVAVSLVIAPVLRFAIGPEVAEQAHVARVVAVAAVPYAVYLALRNPLDAVTWIPFNTINLGITLVLLVALLQFGGSVIAPEWATLLSFCVMGALYAGTWLAVLRVHAVPPTIR